MKMHPGGLEEGVTTPIVEAPQWLLTLVTKPVDRGTQSTTLPYGKIPEGRRNASITSLAGTMRRPGMTEREIQAALLVVNEGRCVPPLSEDDVRRITRSVGKYAPSVSIEAPARTPVPAPMSLGELMAATEPEARYLVDGLIETDSNVLLAAAPKSHKTNIGLHLGVTAAACRPFLGGFPIPNPLRVGLVLMEDRPYRVKKRVRRMCRAEAVDPAKLAGELFTWSRPPLSLGNKAALSELGDFIDELSLDLLLLDSFSYIAVGDSNHADEVTRQLTALSSLRDRRTGLTLVLVHHAAKHQGVGDKGDRVTDIVRGSGAIGAWYDTAILLTRKNERTPVSVRVEHRDLPAPDPFSFTVEDEFPGPIPGGYLRLRRSEKGAEQLVVEARAEELAPALLDRLRELPEGVSRRGLRQLLPDEPWRGVEAAFDVLTVQGTAILIQSPGPGRPACYRATDPAEIG